MRRPQNLKKSLTCFDKTAVFYLVESKQVGYSQIKLGKTRLVVWWFDVMNKIIIKQVSLYLLKFFVKIPNSFSGKYVVYLITSENISFYLLFLRLEYQVGDFFRTFLMSHFCLGILLGLDNISPPRSLCIHFLLKIMYNFCRLSQEFPERIIRISKYQITYTICFQTKFSLR